MLSPSLKHPDKKVLSLSRAWNTGRFVQNVWRADHAPSSFRASLVGFPPGRFLVKPRQLRSFVASSGWEDEGVGVAERRLENSFRISVLGSLLVLVCFSGSTNAHRKKRRRGKGGNP